MPKTRLLFALFFCCFLLQSALAQKQLLVLNRQSNSIVEVSLGTPNAVTEPVLTTGLSNTYDLVLNGASDMLFWCDGLSGHITNASLNELAPIVIQASAASKPVDLEIDLLNNKIWWIDNQEKRVFRANMDGSAKETIGGITLSNPSSLAVYPAKGLYFFADLDSNKIWAGTISDGKASPIIKDEIEYPVRLLVDTIQQKIYWADDGLQKIERANFDGSKRELFYEGTEAEYPFGLFLDQEAAWFYWTDYGTDKVMSADLNGENITEVIKEGLADPIALVIASKQQRPKERSDNYIPQPKVAVFPNPADNLLNIVSIIPDQNLDWVKVYDNKGNMLLKKAKIESTTTAVEISGFPEGYYAYSVSILGKILSGHFTILR